MNQLAGTDAGWDAGTIGRWNGYTQNALHRHGMAAVTPIVEETTGAMPLPVIVGRGVNIVLAAERSFKSCELDALRLFRVSLGFRDLVDHA